MKYKKGFVTNSSTTVYICDVCGNDVAGMDISLSDAEMFICTKGHTFCEDHKVTPKEPSEPACTGNEDIDEDDEYDDRYETDPKFCPVCQLEVLTTGDEVVLLRKMVKMTHHEILAQVKANFGSYDDFKKFLGAKDLI